MSSCTRRAVVLCVLNHNVRGNTLLQANGVNHQSRGRLPWCCTALLKRERHLEKPLGSLCFSTSRHDERKPQERTWRDEKIRKTRGFSSHNSSKRDDRQIQEELKKCKTVKQVLEVYEINKQAMNPWDLSFCWYRISRLASVNREKNMLLESNTSLQKLLKQTTDTVGRFGPMPLSSTASSLARISSAIGWDGGKQLWDRISQRGEVIFDKFPPRSLASIAWAFATAGSESPGLFDCIAEVSVKHLDAFNSQDVANLIWACATSGYASPELFDAVAVLAVPRLNEFKPQHLSNTVWAFATVGRNAPDLFDAVAEIEVARLSEFNPQELSNTLWAFATVGRSAPQLFDVVAEIAVTRICDFKPQGLANMAWAFAMVGRSAPALFDSFGTESRHRLAQFELQHLTNLAWAHAVLDHPSDALFGDFSQFFDLCESNTERFEERQLRQLHQFHLWCQEQGRKPLLSSRLQQKCLHAFVDTATAPSELQKDVATTLKELDLHPQEEVRTEIGYNLDAVVSHRGCKVAVEVDGPSHFHDRSPTGSSLLKHRQLKTLENWCLVSIPYWEYREMQSRDKTETSGRHWRKKYVLESLDVAASKLNC